MAWEKENVSEWLGAERQGPRDTKLVVPEAPSLDAAVAQAARDHSEAVAAAAPCSSTAALSPRQRSPLDGTRVGAGDGPFVGARDGTALGTRVGKKVGTAVGAPEGADGRGDGPRLGSGDGMLLGARLGSRVGTRLGLSDGEGVG